MATKEEIVEVVLRPMVDLYTPPHGISGEKRLNAVKEQFIDALKPYPKPVLEKAWKRVRATHYGWAWPTIQEVVRECNLCS